MASHSCNLSHGEVGVSATAARIVVFTRVSDDQYITITVHVDDESIISLKEGLIKDLKARLKIEYEITDLGILSYTLNSKSSG